jgi:hypothetical protein
MSRVVTRGLRKQLQLEAPQQLIREVVQSQDTHVLKLSEYNRLKLLAMNLNNMLWQKYLSIKCPHSRRK